MKPIVKRIFITLFALAVVVGGTWYLVWLARYPKSPDPAKAELKEAIDFMAQPEFNRLTEAHRRRYVAAVVERHRDMTFQEILREVMDRSQAEKRRQIVKNVKDLPGGEEIGGRILDIFLDKFYQLTEDERTQYLTMLVMAQNTRMAQKAKERGLPDPLKLQMELTRFMSSHSPQDQARMSQFMIDVKRVRRMWGLKDPV